MGKETGHYAVKNEEYEKKTVCTCIVLTRTIRSVAYL